MSCVLQSIFNNNFNFLVLFYLYIYLFGQKCCFCGRFGASIVCEMPDCGRIYHYPCAMAARTYQVRAENISLEEEEEEEPLLIYTAQSSPFRRKKLSVINGSPEQQRTKTTLNI